MGPKILKYKVLLSRRFEIVMPQNSLILSVQTQREQPQLWALTNPEAPPESRYFAVFGTGEDMPVLGEVTINFIGTFQLNGGDFIGHLFERQEGLASAFHRN